MTDRAKELAQFINQRTEPPEVEKVNTIFDQVLAMNQLGGKGEGGNELSDMIGDLKREGLMKKSKKAKGKKMIQEMDYQDQCKVDDCSVQLKSAILPSMEVGECWIKDEGALFSSEFKELQQVRTEQRLTFKELENTKEYAETHYYHIKQRTEHQNLIKPNPYWADLATHLSYYGTFSGFITNNFIHATKCLNEVLLVLGSIDLPPKEGSHGFRSDQGRKVEIKAASNIVIFLKEVMESRLSVNQNLLVVHRYSELNKGETVEFLANTVYQCQVIITNISGQGLNFQALTQIPEGALPLNQSHYQKSHVRHLPNLFEIKKIFDSSFLIRQKQKSNKIYDKMAKY